MQPAKAVHVVGAIMIPTSADYRRIGKLIMGVDSTIILFGFSFSRQAIRVVISPFPTNIPSGKG